MRNEKSQKQRNDAHPNYDYLPLFGDDTAQQINNVDVQVSDLIPAEELDAKLNDIIDAPEINLSSTEAESSEVSNVAPQQNKNVVPHQVEDTKSHQNENVVPLTFIKPARQKKTSKKQSSKKVYSQMRNVVPLKFFLLEHEKIDIKNQASASGCSLSNFIRGKLQLPPNETGRKKQEIKPISDSENSDSNPN
jgi:hypothetical protein